MFVTEWEASIDEPSRLCALFMKEVEAYLRCLYGTKHGDFWMLEKEGCDWILVPSNCVGNTTT